MTMTLWKISQCYLNAHGYCPYICGWENLKYSDGEDLKNLKYVGWGGERDRQMGACIATLYHFLFLTQGLLWQSRKEPCRQTFVQILALPLLNCGTLAKLSNLAEPLCPHP